jgi:HK97 family phage major capsid protein
MLTKQLQEKRHGALMAAKAFTDKAAQESRELTPDEYKRVSSYLDQADALREQLKEKEADEAIARELANMGYTPDGAGPSGSWSKAFIKGLEPYRGYGQKDLLSPSGAIGLPSPTQDIKPLSDQGRVETMLQLIPRRRIDGTDAISYLRETRREHAAAVVAPGALKPTSTYSIERINDRTRTIAHLSEPVPRQYLSNVPALTRYLDVVLREGLTLALEAEVIGGDGTGEHIEGLEYVPGALEQLFESDIFTVTRKAITSLELFSITPSAWCMHPSDWETFELSQDGELRYTLQEPGAPLPVDRARRRLWGLPVALSMGVTQGRAILADWRGAMELYETESARVDWSENGITDGVGHFSTNLVQFRAEGQWGLAIYAPGRIVFVDLAAGS